jgi:hypothetical protein
VNVKKTGSEDMDMAVPKPRSYNQPFTVKYDRGARNLDRGAGPNSKDPVVVYQD